MISDIKEKQELLRKKINKKHGDIILSGDKIADRERQIVSVSPAIDYHIGGIPEGTWLILSGIPKAGKTVTALQIAANAQEKYNKPIYIGNIEYRINEKELKGIHNLDIKNVEMIQSYQGKILTAEDFLEEFTTVIKDVPGCVLIIDSTSALCAEGEFTGEFKAAGRNEGPKLLAKFCRKMTGVVPVQNSIIIIIQHLIANTSGYGEPYFEDGGRKIQHQADTKLRCTSFQKWENGEKEQVGQVISWTVKTSALSKPGTKFKSYLRYGYGLDDTKELISIGLDMGIIEKKASWLIFNKERTQGEDNFREKLLQNKKLYDELRKQIDTML